MNTRMWIMKHDTLGPTGDKFRVDNPANVPRIGEFVESDGVSGTVTHVQYSYRIVGQEIDEEQTFELVIIVIVRM